MRTIKSSVMNRALEAQSKQMTSALVSPGKKQRPGIYNANTCHKATSHAACPTIKYLLSNSNLPQNI